VKHRSFFVSSIQRTVSAGELVGAASKNEPIEIEEVRLLRVAWQIFQC